MNRKDSHLRGILFALGGFTFWVLADALMKLAAEAHLAPYEVVGVMGGVGVLCMLLKTGRTNSIKTLWPSRMKAQIILALLALGSNYCNVIALRHLPLTIFYVAVFTAPMMVAIFSAYFLKEPLGWLKFLAIVAGFAGVIVAINPFGIDLSGTGWIGYAAAFASSVCFALNVTLTRALMQSESTESLVFMNGFVQVIVGVIMAIFLKSETVWSVYIILVLLAAGIMNVGGNFYSTLSLKHAPAATVAPFHYSQIVTGTLVAFLVWHEAPELHFWIGAAMIVATGIYIARADQQQSAEIESD
jgi:drug/metabolite transporter (DMT)-like permease